MAGAYCQFCDQRCFVTRVLRDGQTMHLATCPAGAEHDRAKVGEDHTTAVNPTTDPAVAAAQRITADGQYERAPTGHGSPAMSQQLLPRDPFIQLASLLETDRVADCYELLMRLRCPRCGSGAGHRCRTASGAVTYPHSTRVADAVSFVAYRPEGGAR